jgi:hypothetical protein
MATIEMESQQAEDSMKGWLSAQPASLSPASR